MGDIVGIEIPGVQVVGLIPLGHNIGAGVLARLDDGACIGTVVGINVDDAIAAGLRENCFDVGDPLLTIAFRDQGHVVSADRFRESCPAFIPSGVVGI